MKKWIDQTNIFKFINVMDLTSWLCILATFLFTTFLIWSFDKISPFSLQNNMEEYKDPFWTANFYNSSKLFCFIIYRLGWLVRPTKICIIKKRLFSLEKALFQKMLQRGVNNIHFQIVKLDSVSSLLFDIH